MLKIFSKYERRRSGSTTPELNSDDELLIGFEMPPLTPPKPTTNAVAANMSVTSDCSMIAATQQNVSHGRLDDVNESISYTFTSSRIQPEQQDPVDSPDLFTTTVADGANKSSTSTSRIQQVQQKAVDSPDLFATTDAEDDLFIPETQDDNTTDSDEFMQIAGDANAVTMVDESQSQALFAGSPVRFGLDHRRSCINDKTNDSISLGSIDTSTNLSKSRLNTTDTDMSPLKYTETSCEGTPREIAKIVTDAETFFVRERVDRSESATPDLDYLLSAEEDEAKDSEEDEPNANANANESKDTAVDETKSDVIEMKGQVEDLSKERDAVKSLSSSSKGGADDGSTFASISNVSSTSASRSKIHTPPRETKEATKNELGADKSGAEEPTSSSDNMDKENDDDAATAMSDDDDDIFIQPMQAPPKRPAKKIVNNDAFDFDAPTQIVPVKDYQSTKKRAFIETQSKSNSSSNKGKSLNNFV